MQKRERDLHIRVDDELATAITETAARYGRTITEEIRRALRRHYRIGVAETMAHNS